LLTYILFLNYIKYRVWLGTETAQYSEKATCSCQPFQKFIDSIPNRWKRFRSSPKLPDQFRILANPQINGYQWLFPLGIKRRRGRN
jgi:hypothetical protein